MMGDSLRVLVTGGNGWIGKATVTQLEAAGHTVTVFDTSGGLDITRSLDVRVTVQDARPDVVINLAGVLGTSETYDHLALTTMVNVMGAVHLLTECAALGIPVVQIGTGHKGQLNPYAVTKACAEDLALCLRAEGHQVAVVRAYHAYGPGQKVLKADGGTGKVQKIFPTFAVAALRGEPIKVYGSGNNVIDMVHVDDVAEALVSAAEALTSGTRTIGGVAHDDAGVWQAGTGVPRTVLEVAAALADAAGSTAGVVHLPMRRGEPDGAVVVAPSGSALCADRWETEMPESLRWYEAAAREGRLP
jgi:UDP-glucose 4-epimerase